MSATGWADRLWDDPRARIVAAACAFAALTAVTYLVADPKMHTGVAPYDDEGYMLAALKGFINHGDLYDRVFTQYGPFYYEFWGGLFSLFGVPVDHDSARAVVTVVWVLTSLTLGLATMRMTASLLLGLAVQMLVFGALTVFSNEPMHPGGILCLLLALIVAISCFVRDRPSPYAMGALGGAVAALVLVKINIGVFALASLALACVLSYPVLWQRRWLRLAVEAGFVGIPVLLMLGRFGDEWVRHYAAHVAIAALAAIIALRARDGGRRPPEELGWLAGGFIAVAAAVCLTIVAAGTSPGGLLDGVLRQPLRQADAFTAPLPLSQWSYGIDLLALAGALAYSFASRGRGSRSSGGLSVAFSILSIVVGLAMAPAVAGETFPFGSGDPLDYPLSMLAFCWVALVAPAPGAGPAVAFARLLLPLLAVLQSLHAYPVAGSQIRWSGFLLIPVGALCLANGVRGIYGALAADTRRRALVTVAAAGAVLLMGLVANTTLRKPLLDNRAAYDALVPLDLPGAESVRVSGPEARTYGKVSAAIERHCPALVMLPGMDSFYVWTEQEPPTGYNATAWPTLFDDAHQQGVISDTRSIDGLCLLENARIARFWSLGPVPSGPLVRYLHRGFAPVARFGDYRLLKRESGFGA